MAFLIGDNAAYGTWAAVRRPIFSSDTTFVTNGRSIEFTNGFMTSAGLGFVRSNLTIPYLGGPYIALIPPNLTELALSGGGGIPLDEEDALELVGGTVTSALGSIVLTTDYFTPTGQSIAGTTYFDPASVIDKLTPF